MNCPECDKKMLAVEYSYDDPHHYDGISEFRCPDDEGCGVRIGRWSGKRLYGDEAEPRFGGKP